MKPFLETSAQSRNQGLSPKTQTSFTSCGTVKVNEQITLREPGDQTSSGFDILHSAASVGLLLPAAFSVKLYCWSRLIPFRSYLVPPGPTGPSDTGAPEEMGAGRTFRKEADRNLNHFSLDFYFPVCVGFSISLWFHFSMLNVLTACPAIEAHLNFWQKHKQQTEKRGLGEDEQVGRWKNSRKRMN